MALEPPEPSPLDYRSPGVPRTRSRWVIVTSIGAVVALAGVIVFLCAHAISAPPRGATYSADHQRLHELLWGAFGIALMLVGALLAAVGLTSWCRKDAR